MYKDLDYEHHIQQRNLLAKEMESLLARRSEMALEYKEVDDWFTQELGKALIESLDIDIQKVQEDKAKHQEYIDKFMDQNE